MIAFADVRRSPKQLSDQQVHADPRQVRTYVDGNEFTARATRNATTGRSFSLLIVPLESPSRADAVPMVHLSAGGGDVRGVRTVGHARVVTTTSDTDPLSSDATSAWSPLRIVAFRALWLAQLASMIGTWMQTVGAQWLLIDEPDAPTLVSLVQTASLLPMLLLALPAGVLADSFDRRRLLVGVQLSTLVVSGILTAATAFGEISPKVLLALTFLIGCGQAMSMPPWQALIPDVVPTRGCVRPPRSAR